MNNLLSVNSSSDIPLKYSNTPIGFLLEYHNLKRPYEEYSSAQLLVGMCMDNRNNLNIPDNFSFIMRAGGANFQTNEFHISYALGVGNLKYYVLIGHSDCGMVNLEARKSVFVDGLIRNAGWTKEQAQKYFVKFAPQFEVYNGIEFTLSEVIRLRKVYPEITIAPMFYKVEDRRLYMIKE
jgi:carbonic anhydrase